LTTRDAVQETTDVLVMAANSTIPLYEKTEAHLSALSERYKGLTVSYGEATETAITCLKDLGEQLDQRLDRMGNGTPRGNPFSL
jgi:hypothetical protein